MTQRDALSLVARNIRNCSFRNRSKFGASEERSDAIVTRLPKVHEAKFKNDDYK